MIQSLTQIDFIHSGGTLRLLDIGAIIAQDPVIAVKQAEQRHAAIGAEWSEKQALGGAETSASWTAVRNHASHAALHGFCMSHAAAFPSGKTGVLRITISGGDVWDIQDAALSSCNPQPLLESASFETVTTYSASGGRLLPGAPITLYAGIPWDYILQDWDSLTGDWDAL
jgi:hypothetical protein